MAQVFTKSLLSGSTNGKGVKIVATSTPGTTIHTAVSGTSSLDEIWLYAYNGHTANVTLTIEWGGVAVPDDNIVIDIPYKQGKFLVMDGGLLQNSLVVKCFASVTNVVVITGFVNAIV